MVMWIPLVALVLGVLAGAVLPLQIPIFYGRYMSVALLAALDSSFGGLRASMEGKFRNDVFITGFFSNALLAAGLTYVGDRLGVELYFAALVAFGLRIFNNLGAIRHALLAAWARRASRSRAHH